MAIIVEDGTGLSTAESYVDVQYVTDYLTKRNKLGEWGDASVAQKEGCVVRATEYIDLMFGDRFLGCLVSKNQALEFPRTLLYDRYGNSIEGVPIGVKRATAEYALRSLSQDLLPDPMNQNIEEETKRVGPITKSINYRTRPRIRKSFPSADKYLKEYLMSGGGTYR